MKLVLFDVDGTLLATDGAGRRAMESAGRELYGASFSTRDVPFAGSLDPLIWAALAERNEVDDREDGHARFRAAYARHLAAAFSAGARPRILPGVVELLDALARQGGRTLGLLTGNYPETARAKLAAAGLGFERFALGAWGDDGPRRVDLVPVARARHLELVGDEAPASAVLVVGDTPADVECASAHGCRSLAVTTGPFGRAALEAAGADLVLDSLGDTTLVLDWMR